MKNVFAIYKPKGITSNDVVVKLKKFFNEGKVGHAGTLDPLAEGILVVGVGREATKELRHILEEEKEYVGVVKLGENSETDDSEGKKFVTNYKLQITNDDIQKILPKFVGSSIWQMPPTYSAVKAGGKKAYEVARKGGKPMLGPRQVEIKDIKILDYKWPYLKIKVVCGSGTYIRSLARDIGEELGCGGYLADLKRIRVGGFSIDSARNLADFNL